MTAKERLIAAIKGDKVDRPPLWLREGFTIGVDPTRAPIHDVQGSGVDPEFVLGWKHEPLYRELFEYVEPHIVGMRSWGLGEHINRYLLIPADSISREIEHAGADRYFVNGRVDARRGALSFRNELRRGVNTYWHVDHLVESVEDLEMLAEIAWSFDPGVLPRFLAEFEEQRSALADNGVMRLEYPSPIVAISATMSLQRFLEMSVTHRGLFHELLRVITERLITITDELFSRNGIDTIVNFGGSEQCTPPLMAPEAFDEYVVPYDGEVIARLKSYGITVNMHCHGKVRHALTKMIEMGVDSTDPVEPPPAGDVTFTEAREIAGDGLTLNGNLEFDELEHRDSDHIRARVREITSFGKRRLVIGASAGPISAVSRRLVDNYKALIDEYVQIFDGQ